jgi:SpoVK/Ycf46/Vps4 family AAA+-type ATPase
VDIVRRFVDALPADKTLVVVTQEDLMSAAAACRPSVTEKELEKYEQLNSRYSDMQ